MSMLVNPYIISPAVVVNFRTYLLSLSPVAYYPMDETSGTLMDALAGTDGTYLGSPTLGNAPILPNDPGTSMGTTLLENRGRTNVALSGAADFTISIAMRSSAVAQQMIIFDQDNSSGGTPRTFLAVNRGVGATFAAGQVCAFFHAPSGSTNRNVIAASANVTDGNGHLIVYGRSGSTPFIDVDGVPQTLSGDSISAGSVFGGTYWGIGQTPISGATSVQYSGDVAHFACWDRALSPSERSGLGAAAGF